MHVIVFYKNRNRTNHRKLEPQPTPDTEIRLSEEIEDPNKRAADCNVNTELTPKINRIYIQSLYFQYDCLDLRNKLKFPGDNIISIKL